MPERNTHFVRLMIFLMAIVVILSVIGTTATILATSFASSSRDNAKSAKENAAAARESIDSLKKSSARSECRTQLTNDDVRLNNLDTHEFQQDIINILLDGRTASDQAKQIASAAKDRIQDSLNRETAQQAIDQQCPPPLVSSPVYTIPTVKH